MRCDGPASLKLGMPSAPPFSRAWPVSAPVDRHPEPPGSVDTYHGRRPATPMAANSSRRPRQRASCRRKRGVLPACSLPRSRNSAPKPSACSGGRGAPVIGCWARIHDRGGDLRLLVVPCGLSGGDLVLVREPAEDLSSVDPVLGEVGRLRWLGASPVWCELVEGTVRPGCVVMRQILGQDLAQVVLTDDKQPAGEFPVQGADHPFADGVRSGCLRRAGENPRACCGEHGVEGVGELARAIPDQEPD